MTALNMVLMLWGLGLCVVTLPGLIELVLVTAGALRPYRNRRPVQAGRPDALRLVCVVPAHNEAATIARCVRSLLACPTSEAPAPVVVVADNCTDDTAGAARAAGAEVLVRNEPTRRGKGFALDHAFRTLTDWDAALVVDADSVVAPTFIEECRRLFAEGADGVQVWYGVLNAEASRRTRLMQIALFAFNLVRPLGRECLGLSAGLLGNGFGLTRDTLRAVPYGARSIVEDLEYHLLLVRAGRRIRFTARTAVWADMPVGSAAAAGQRARWEGGRLHVMRIWVPVLVREILTGRVRLIEPALELLMPPLGVHVAVLAAACLTPLAFVRAWGLAGLAITALHVAVSIRLGGGGWRQAATLALAPWYVVMKLLALPRILRGARRDAQWLRTDRELERPHHG
jgi:cellulose synthase/poly-beta-1,6-N-acetylglucosamine synthase-like glycosyltransferase